MNKTTFFVLSCALIFLSGCKTEPAAYDLIEDAPYAQERGGIFAVDLLKPEGDPYVMGGWSTVRKDGTRLGVYPVSRIKLPIFEHERLYLIFKCAPFTRDQIPAKGFRFRMKNETFAQVKLEHEAGKWMKVTIPLDTLESRENILQIDHVLDEEIEKNIDQMEKKRIRTAILYEMLLSSFPDYEVTKRFLELKKRVDSERSDVLIQKVPSTLDYYIEISPDVRLDASFEYIAADPSAQNSPVDLIISLEEQGKENTVIFQTPLGRDRTTGKIQLDLPVEKKKVVRLGLQAGEWEGTDTLEGVLIWKKSFILEKTEKRINRTREDEKFLEWKQSLADKNTVIIILDAARADHFSSYGYFRPTTPNLDNFAEEAVLFTHAFCEALTTRPSIGTLFTGFPLTVLSLYEITSQLPEEFTTLAQMYQQKKIKTAGFAGVGNISSSFGFDKGFDQYFELYREEGFYRKSQEYLPYLFPWLESNKNNRFFLYVHFKEPHGAYSPLPPFKGMFTGTYKETVDFSAHLEDIANSFTKEQIEYVRAGYDENLASVDSVVGEFIAKMRSLGILDQSIIIVTADHGELLGEKDKMFGHGGYFGEAGMHIPLLIRFPKSDHVKIPAKVDALVKTSDLLVTLADIHDFDIHEDLLSGKSLLPLIREPESEVNPYMVAEKSGLPGYCYRTKQHKLIYWMGIAPLEFYNLDNDPEAMTNVYEQNKILAHFYLTNLKKWIVGQNLIKDVLLKADPSKREIDMKQIDEKTLENLKALGYIK
jgi:arylsulfatase A-like enzyme